MSDSVPELVTTLTGWSGRTAVAFFAGVTVTVAAAGSADGLLLVVVPAPGVVGAPGVELLWEPPAGGLPASESLHPAATTSIAQIPATARPRLRTELPNTLFSPLSHVHRRGKPSLRPRRPQRTGSSPARRATGPAVLMTIGTAK
jgi:hypothetical protein